MIEPIKGMDMQMDYSQALCNFLEKFAIDDSGAALMEKITADHCRKGSLKPHYIHGPSREKKIVKMRHDIWREIYETRKFSFPEIGRHFGRDHTTVLYGVNKSKERALGREAGLDASRGPSKTTAQPCAAECAVEALEQSSQREDSANIAKPEQKSMRTCKHPECTATIGKGNTTGLCQQHIHAPGICECKQCQEKAERMAAISEETAAINAYFKSIPHFRDSGAKRMVGVVQPRKTFQLSGRW